MDELQKLVQHYLDSFFPYLQSYGFNDLREEEEYFICPWYFLANGIIELSIQCQGKASLLHLCIDKYDFRLLEPDNIALINIENKFNNYYDIAFNNSNQSKKQVRKLEKENAIQQLEKLEVKWLTEMSAILFRHSNVLTGNFELLAKNFEQKHQQDKAKENQERIEKGMFSLELYQFPMNEVDPFYDEIDPFNCVLEFPSLDEVREYLEKHQEVKIYRILDCYLNEIKIDD